jgi:hypothetical protein
MMAIIVLPRNSPPRCPSLAKLGAAVFVAQDCLPLTLMCKMVPGRPGGPLAAMLSAKTLTRSLPIDRDPYSLLFLPAGSVATTH